MRIRNWLAVIAAGLMFAGGSVQGDTMADAQSALAPTGNLRVGFLLAPIYGVKNADTGEINGLGVDLGKEMAKKLGVHFVAHPYKDLGSLIAAAKAGEIDIALTNPDEKRKAVLDFTVPYLWVEHGYLVRAGVPINSMAEVDKEGIRVGTLKNSATHTLLSSSLKSAKLIPVDNLAELKDLLVSGNAETIAIGKPFLYGLEGKLAGSHVLDGNIRSDETAMGVVKGRNPAAIAFAKQFIDDVKAGTLVSTAIERDKLVAAHATPPK